MDDIALSDRAGAHFDLSDSFDDIAAVAYGPTGAEHSSPSLDRALAETATYGGAPGPVAAPTVSVVIPAFNHAATIDRVLDRIPGWVYEVVVVDGRSADGTSSAARRARSDVRVVHQDGQGRGDALRCGFATAGGDIIVVLDADGSADPAEIPRFLAALRTGADFAKGSRFLIGGGVTGISLLRRLQNNVLRSIVNAVWKAEYSDLCYGYNAFWRRCLPKLHLDSSGLEAESLLHIKAVKANLAVVEVPSFEDSRWRPQGATVVLWHGLRVLRTILAERLRPL